MLTLITGGSASGKSAYAEMLAVQSGGALFYIATMQPFDTESKHRIERHQNMRAGKGFTTIECYTDIKNLAVPKDATVLLECMSNLAANELYSPDGAGENMVSAIMQGMTYLQEQAAYLLIVSNELFSTGESYDDSTMQYLHMLGEINCRLAAVADEVIEVVCGIPIYHKKKGVRTDVAGI